MRRIPTEKQMERLSNLAHPGAELLTAKAKPEWIALKNRGWLESGRTKESLRITPAGLRALADALEAYGRPS